MKFLTGSYEEREFIGFVQKNEKILDLNRAAMHLGIKLPDTLLGGIQLGAEFIQIVTTIVTTFAKIDASLFEYRLDDKGLNLLAPIPRPIKNILCVGKNYSEHVLEMGSAADIPVNPMIFTKAPTTVIGHGENIMLHEDITDALDYEGELAIVIGKKGTGITEAEAFNHVFGYTLLNDITARDLQTKHKQFFLGKSLDTSCPIGPFLVHKSEIKDPHDLAIMTKVNGEIRQNGLTKDMIFSIPTLIAVLSKGMTLEPGDIIATGTPSGVGKGFKPPRFLNNGDIIEITIDQIGTLTNTVL